MREIEWFLRYPLTAEAGAGWIDDSTFVTQVSFGSGKHGLAIYKLRRQPGKEQPGVTIKLILEDTGGTRRHILPHPQASRLILASNVGDVRDFDLGSLTLSDGYCLAPSGNDWKSEDLRELVANRDTESLVGLSRQGIVLTRRLKYGNCLNSGARPKEVGDLDSKFIRLSPDGTHAAFVDKHYGQSEAEIGIYNLETKEIVFKSPHPVGVLGSTMATADWFLPAAISPNNQLVAAWGNTEYDVQLRSDLGCMGKVFVPTPKHQSAKIRFLAFNHDGSVLYGSSYKGNVTAWNVLSGEPKFVLITHTDDKEDITRIFPSPGPRERFFAVTTKANRLLFFSLP